MITLATDANETNADELAQVLDCGGYGTIEKADGVATASSPKMAHCSIYEAIHGEKCVAVWTSGDVIGFQGNVVNAKRERNE